jgi:outer membrane lipopolysaccharide assembly protein LptE/RlpB
MFRQLLTIALVLLLTGCGSIGNTPTLDLVRRAISIQISQTQQELAQQLQLDQPPTWEIQGLSIQQQEIIRLDLLVTFHLRGTYNLRLHLPTQQMTRRKTPFDVYLQRQAEGKTWRLALPEVSSEADKPQEWKTYLIKPPKYD